MKLIIDIPEWEFNKIKENPLDTETMLNISLVVKHGIPLDDVKAEIKKLDEGITSYKHDKPWVYKYEVLEILDNIGKAESEVKPND